MPAGHPQRNPPPDSHHHAPLPSNSKATHIRNKDGTKLITVPPRKPSNPEPSPTGVISPPPPLPQPHATDYSNGTPVNNTGGGKKKKKKKGGKHTAQHQQQAQVQGTVPTGGDVGYARDQPPQAHQYQQDIKRSMAGFDDGDEPPELIDQEEDDDYYSDEEGVFEHEEPYSPTFQIVRPPPAPAPTGKKKNKKKKKKGNAGSSDAPPPPPPPPLQQQQQQNRNQPQRKGKDRIWNTSTAEERERIKDFWLSLGEEERRSLVKVEKEAVLRKMKEQQKHSCSCSVCGRKRTAIEEELEVLYDAYYEELEQYANQQQTSKYLGHIRPNALAGTYSSSNIPPPPPPPGPPPTQDTQRINYSHRVEELEDEFEDDEEDEECEDEDVLDHPLPPPPVNDPRPDFFNFGNSLTVQGGILTVADDLLKNDGKKFIEMMEQLAERRMAREAEANAAANGHTPVPLSTQQAHAGHSHTEYDDEEEYDEEEDEDYDDEEEEEEEDEPDTMTEEQRMEEGRRMFQIFAARMFEQRVLTAYREKVARERQRKLLEELEEESRRNQEREEKKAKDKDKKKEKKRMQRLAKEEERLKREAEKAAEEAKQRVIEAKKAEEQRKRKEEQRLKREAEKRAAEEDRQRKEEERRKRVQEEKEREAERDRKRKEHQERERKKKEEAARKAKEEKEAKEREAREKREKEEKERKEREAKAKREAAEKEKKRREEEAKAKAEAALNATAKRAQPSNSHSQVQPPPGYGSPHLGVVTPAVPKQSPVPRPRQASQQSSIQNSQGSSPKTPHIGPRIGSTASPSTPVMGHTLPGPINVPNKAFGFPPPGGMTPTSPMPHHILPPPPGVPHPDPFASMSPLGMNGHIQPFMPPIPQRQSIGNGMPMFPTSQGFMPSPQFRYGVPNGPPIPASGPPGMRPVVGQGRGFMDMPPQLPPGVLPPSGSPFVNREPMPIGAGHSRVPSGSFESVHRPTPIQRPASVAPLKPSDDGQNGVDELSKVMGSRALLEDEDSELLPENVSPSRRASNVQFAPRPIRGVPTTSPLFGDSFGDFGGASWSNPMPLGGSLSGSLPSASGWGSSGAGWSDTDAARSTFNRRRVGRIDQIRMLACQKCRELGGSAGQFVELAMLQRAIQQTAPPELSFQAHELTNILDIEGDAQNGGGEFKINRSDGRTLVLFELDNTLSELNHAPPHRLGEIGSPSMHGAIPVRHPPLGPPGVASPAGF